MTRRLRPWAAGVAAAGLLATVIPTAVTAPAQAAASQSARLTVMSQNLYLGSSLNPALEAEGAAEFLAAVAEIYETAVATDFPTRAKTIAANIAAERPDLIGLQEVTKWTATRTDGGPDLPNYDFLEILLAELEAVGMNYVVAGTVDNADISAPLINPLRECGGAFPNFDCSVSLLDRDAILINVDSEIAIKLNSLRTGRFKAQASFDTPLGARSFDRGWLYLDLAYEGRQFRFANTHLEVEDFAAVQEAQAREFAEIVRTGWRHRIIATGDFNSAADGSTSRSYRILTRSFTDLWNEERDGVGLTCCQDSALDNVESKYRTRIDLVLGQGRLSSNWSRVLPLPIEGAESLPLWGSDHGGVITRVRLR